jgi:hypothetical protein
MADEQTRRQVMNEVSEQVRNGSAFLRPASGPRERPGVSVAYPRPSPRPPGDVGETNGHE